MEMVAHGDGAFYRPHTDTYAGDEYTPGGRRRLTMAYYLHHRPRRFVGVRSLFVFPSSARHEVETISCPTAHSPAAASQ